MIVGDDDDNDNDLIQLIANCKLTPLIKCFASDLYFSFERTVNYLASSTRTRSIDRIPEYEYTETLSQFFLPPIQRERDPELSIIFHLTPSFCP